MSHLRARIHETTFSNTGVVTGFLHEITGERASVSGDSLSFRVHECREYNRKCMWGNRWTGLAIQPQDPSNYVPTHDALFAAQVPWSFDNSIYLLDGSTNWTTFDGYNLELIT